MRIGGGVEKWMVIVPAIALAVLVTVYLGGRFDALPDMGNLSKLDAVIDKVEFKLTVVPEDEQRVQAMLRSARVRPARRKVYFYDTPRLDLLARDVRVGAAPVPRG